MTLPEVQFTDDGLPIMLWFGESWGAPVCTEDTHAETPVNQPCTSQCGTPIREDDVGFLVPHIGLEDVTYNIHHHVCYMRGIFGPSYPEGFH